jgi:hypothetical protein
VSIFRRNVRIKHFSVREIPVEIEGSMYHVHSGLTHREVLEIALRLEPPSDVRVVPVSFTKPGC